MIKVQRPSAHSVSSVFACSLRLQRLILVSARRLPLKAMNQPRSGIFSLGINGCIRGLPFPQPVSAIRTIRFHSMFRICLKDSAVL